MLNEKYSFVIAPCACGPCCMFVVQKRTWEDGDIDFNISLEHC